MPDDNVMLADGFDNTGDLVAFNEMNPPLFALYRWELASEWFDAAGERNDAYGLPTFYGKPRVKLTFDVMTQDEYLYLRTTFGREVTIHAYNREEQRWADYNGYLLLPRLTGKTWRQGFWVDVEIDIVKLTEIVP